MGFLRAQVTLPADTNVPSDAAVNVWHFETPAAASGGMSDAAAKLVNFYQAIDSHLALELASPATIKFYDLEDASPRVPIGTDTITLTPSVGTSLPSECAIALSYQADPVSGQSQARRRGRIFLGPLAQVTANSAAGRTIVSPTTVALIAGAASTMATAAPLLNAIWSVFSPTTAGPEPWSGAALATAFVPVTNGWIDNAFDVQRRRGIDSTIRTTWT